MEVIKDRSAEAALKLETSVQYIKGVGPRIGGILARAGISHVRDLVETFPRAYETRKFVRRISELRDLMPVIFLGQIKSIVTFPLGKTGRRGWQVLVSDGSGQVTCVFFRQPYFGYFDRLRELSQVKVAGQVQVRSGRLEMHHPDLAAANPAEAVAHQIAPIYVEIEGFSSAKFLRLIQTALQALRDPAWKVDLLPESVRQHYQLMARHEAIEKIHFPLPEQHEAYSQRRSPAHRRLIFEEFFWLELELAAQHMGHRRGSGPLIRTNGEYAKKLQGQLPFALTEAQLRVFQEIRKDLCSGWSMHRLVQGDVGSGKTLVAFLAAAEAAEGGLQSCLMAPTEILAEQHLANAKRWLEPLGLKVALLVGKMSAAERAPLLAKLREGQIDILIGTQALLEAPVRFQNLGLAMIDEQHRFGVEQRTQLRGKGKSPHVLVLTATPIPRTLAMTAYGDLDISTVDELPPGRTPITTRAVQRSKRDEVLQFLSKQVEAGRQAYIVYPLVEESEKIDLANANSSYDELTAKFPGLRFGLLHGRLSGEEKDEVMRRFKANEIQVLIATTVIEVGVDVPNATLMIVEHAERFGLSQLHQLRGRVGRGQLKSYCVLILGAATSRDAYERVRFLESTSDGFKVSEFDLKLRGPGEFLGTRQSGLSGFKLAELTLDADILEDAREAAFALLQSDPKLKKAEHLQMRQHLEKIRLNFCGSS